MKKQGSYCSFPNDKSSCRVKLVKCLIQKVVVGISVSQIRGLCTLHFLEKTIFRSCLILSIVSP